MIKLLKLRQMLSGLPVSLCKNYKYVNGIKHCKTVDLFKKSLTIKTNKTFSVSGIWQARTWIQYINLSVSSFEWTLKFLLIDKYIVEPEVHGHIMSVSSP